MNLLPGARASRIGRDLVLSVFIGNFKTPHSQSALLVWRLLLKRWGDLVVLGAASCIQETVAMSAIYIHAGAVAGGINELKSVLLQLMHPMKPGGSAGPGWHMLHGLFDHVSSIQHMG